MIDTPNIRTMKEPHLIHGMFPTVITVNSQDSLRATSWCHSREHTFSLMTRKKELSQASLGVGSSQDDQQELS